MFRLAVDREQILPDCGDPNQLVRLLMLDGQPQAAKRISQLMLAGSYGPLVGHVLRRWRKRAEEAREFANVPVFYKLGSHVT
jgi:hypothetical protein